MPPTPHKDVNVLILKTHEHAALYGKGDFADGMDFELGRLSWITGWAQGHHHGGKTVRDRKGVETEAGAVSQGPQGPLGAGKGKDVDSLLKASALQNSKIINVGCFKPLVVVAFYSAIRKVRVCPDVKSHCHMHLGFVQLAVCQVRSPPWHD